MAVHQADRGREGAARLAPGLGERPEPGEVDVGVAGERERAGRRVRPRRRARAAVDERRARRRRRRARRRRAPAGAGRGPAGSSQTFCSVLGAGDARDVGERRARPVELARAPRGGVGERRDGIVVRPERARGLEHQREPADERVERHVDAHHARDARAGRRGWASPNGSRATASRVYRERFPAEREARDARDRARTPSRSHRRRRAEERLAAEVEPQPGVLPRHRDLRVGEDVDVFAIGPRAPSGCGSPSSVHWFRSNQSRSSHGRSSAMRTASQSRRWATLVTVAAARVAASAGGRRAAAGRPRRAH